jgi:hypothetical protein
MKGQNKEGDLDINLSTPIPIVDENLSRNFGKKKKTLKE